MSRIRFIVPFGRGGASDRAARSLAGSVEASAAADAQAQEATGIGSIESSRCWVLIIENLPGAGGRFGVARANQLARSGIPTLLLGTPTTHILLRARLGEAAAPDDAFRPLIGLGSAPSVLLVSPRLGVRSVGELIARATRERLVYASAGAGQTIHVLTALFCRQAGIRMTHKPYDGGSAAAYPDLIAGRIHVYFDNLLGCRDMVAQGRVVPLAVSDAQRCHLLPEVPSLAEAGIRWQAPEVWLGVFCARCPDGFADPIVRTLRDVALADELRKLGLAGGPVGPEGMATQLESSTPEWRRALAASGEEAIE
ncbi:MAG: tripartite tricarboxylate transporter substrate binding protein [Burkholderiales bacterium]|nr:tripartite tricarboxylate transporter substrate binding protein [Burkholderiales bacterium]